MKTESTQKHLEKAMRHLEEAGKQIIKESEKNPEDRVESKGHLLDLASKLHDSKVAADKVNRKLEDIEAKKSKVEA